MARRGPATKRRIDVDPVFRSLLVSQIINKVLLKGKKEKARSIVYGALEIVERRTKQDPLVVLKRAIDNLRPSVEVSPRRSNTLAIRWLVDFARKRKERTMAERLASEILDASNRTGMAYKRREDVHKMAESNKAFAHYRW